MSGERLASAVELIERYDAFLIDLWGVVHDGQALYPGALSTLKEIFGAGKKIVFLSNAPRRASAARKRLIELGVPAAIAEHVVTSGEAAYHDLSRNPKGWRRYAYLGPERDRDLLRGLDYYPAAPDSADFILNCGFTDDNEPVDFWMPLLKACCKHDLPMICANPDLIVVRQSGEVLGCAGLLANTYKDMGGTVTWYGKPYPAVYAEAKALLGDIPDARICAIGDSLDTDIKGASRAGIKTALVGGGILKSVLYPVSTRMIDEEALAGLVKEAGVTPDHIIPALAG